MLWPARVLKHPGPNPRGTAELVVRDRLILNASLYERHDAEGHGQEGRDVCLYR
jgi:hypothetical protein